MDVVEDLKGFNDIHFLLSHPNPETDIAAFDIVGSGPVAGLTQSDPIADSEAIRAYKQEAAELQSELDRARKNSDEAAITRVSVQLQHVTQELMNSRKEGGSVRMFKGGASNAAAAVHGRLKNAYKRLEDSGFGDFAGHLRQKIRQRRYGFSYRPGNVPPAWKLEEDIPQ